MKKQDVINVRGYNETILIGQLGECPDVEAFMLSGGDMMVICNNDGPNYMTKKQAIEMFNITIDDIAKAGK